MWSNATERLCNLEEGKNAKAAAGDKGAVKASISYEGDAAACVDFWRSDYEKREGSFHVLHSWLMAFPRHLPDLLGLLAGLASGGGALFVAELLQAPLNSLQLPYRLLRHLTDFEAYVEELALRLMALELPETPQDSHSRRLRGISSLFGLDEVAFI
ncbi:hypothetical protein AK812_SmicGene13642 [Symbiodinium microadriaticum]|uniref:Uncharacterized protein n=1 Tax=Symbiodinium microadriaticum TaxID=2951 RepID=A0A1Q9E7J6_SYMMI|nr:hypothetical protein AK812_SmicGene13642 [Symbiodinium microadriaticum]